LLPDEVVRQDGFRGDPFYPFLIVLLVLAEVLGTVLLLRSVVRGFVPWGLTEGLFGKCSGRGVGIILLLAFLSGGPNARLAPAYVH